MKKIVVITMNVCLLCSLSFGFSQNRAARKQNKEEALKKAYLNTVKLIESGSYSFSADWAIPLGDDVMTFGENILGGNSIFQGNRINLSGNSNHVTFSNDSVTVNMPFFGRAFFANPTNSGHNSFNYNGVLEDYKVNYNDKKKAFNH